MYPASSRHPHARTRPAPLAKGGHRRPLLEPLERRALLSATLAWAQHYGLGADLVTDPSGFLYTTDPAGNLHKFRPDGSIAWTTPGIPLGDTVRAATGAGVYTRGANAVSRYSPGTGALLWSRPVPAALTTDIAVAPDDSIYLTGRFTGTIDADPGPGVFNLTTLSGGPDVALVKLDASGNFVRAQVIGSSGTSSGVVDINTFPQIDTDAAGNVFAAVTYDVSPRPPLTPGRIQLTRFAADGSVLWTQAVASTDTTVTDLAASGTGGFVIGGVTPATADFDPDAPTVTLATDPYIGTQSSSAYVARYDAHGTLLWLHAVRPNSPTHHTIDVRDIDITDSGDVAVLASVFAGPDLDGFVRRFGPEGQLTGDFVYPIATRLALSPDAANLYLSGIYRNNPDFDPGPATYQLNTPADDLTRGFLLRLTTTSGQGQPLTGTPIGTPGSWNASGNDLTKAFDRDPTTFFDAPTSQAWVGLDFGSPRILQNVAITPRAGLAWRMVGGLLQGSNDASNWTTLATVDQEPPATGFAYPLSNPTPFRYLRYLSPVGGYGNIAELAAVGYSPIASQLPPTTPTYARVYATGPRIFLQYADLAVNETRYEIQLFNNPTFSGTPVATTQRPANFTTPYIDAPATGTYYLRVRAVNDFGPSAWLTTGPVQATVPQSDPGSRLTGTPIGTPGSWNNSGNTFLKALDGNPSTFFDAPTPQAFVGYDFGAPVTPTQVRFAPRAGLAERMVGGLIQGSNDATNWDTLATITSAPPAQTLTALPLSSPTAYRYLRYLSPVGGYGNIGELAFYGTGTPTPVTPAAPTNVNLRLQGTEVRLEWTDASTNETAFEIELSTDSNFSNVVRRASIPNTSTGVNYAGLPAGTYFGRVRATNDAGASPWVAAGPVTLTTGNSITLTGLPIGTPGSWNNSGNDLTKAFDRDPSTFFDAPTSQAWVGLDLGNPALITAIRFAPRPGLADRMTWGLFQGSHDGTNWLALAPSINPAPADGVITTLPVSNPTPFRYVRYLSTAGGFGNIAELEFLGIPDTSTPNPNIPTAPTNLSAELILGATAVRYTWNDLPNEFNYYYQASRFSDFSSPFSFGPIAANTTSLALTIPGVPDALYFRIRAESPAGVSPFSTLTLPLVLT